MFSATILSSEFFKFLIISYLCVVVDLVNTNGVVHITVIWMVISSLLPWIIHRTIDSRDVDKSVDSIFEMAEGKAQVRYRKSCVVSLVTDEHLLQYIASSRSSHWALVLLRFVLQTDILNILRLESRVMGTEIPSGIGIESSLKYWLRTCDEKFSPAFPEMFTKVCTEFSANVIKILSELFQHFLNSKIFLIICENYNKKKILGLFQCLHTKFLLNW